MGILRIWNRLVVGTLYCVSESGSPVSMALSLSGSEFDSSEDVIPGHPVGPGFTGVTGVTSVVFGTLDLGS